ncbi:MAG: DUF6798 domain-containing protein [Acidimicrobiia bacterium]
MADVARGEELGARPGARHLILPTLLVLGVTLVLYGWPVPRLSEELYLPLVRRVAHPSYLRGDWTFGGDFAEHWLFDHIFSPVAGALSVDAFGWLGRLVFWPVLGLLLIRLGNRFGLSPWAAAGAVTFWLLSNQAAIGGEWILGTFEAKTVAYVCLLGALLAITARRIPLGLALLGLTLSFHPAVGLWSAWAAGIALLALPETRRSTLRWCWLAILLAVPGILGGLSAAGDPSNALQRFVVLQAIPYHTDPFFGGKTLGWAQVVLHTAIVLAMFGFNVWSYSKSDHNLTQRFFAAFQVAAAVPFVFAYIARAFDLWSFLRLMPLRSFPLIVPLVFFFQSFRYARQLAQTKGVSRRKRRRARRDAALVVVATLAIAVLPTSPLLAAPRMISRNFKAWTTVDHMARAFDWVRENTPTDTHCIFPVDRQDSFDRSERPQVANWQAIPYDRLAEWKSRIDDLVGGPGYFAGSDWHGDLPTLRAAYNRLTTEQIDHIAAKYHADCLVSETKYPYQVVHQDGPVRVYAIKPF